MHSIISDITTGASLRIFTREDSVEFVSGILGVVPTLHYFKGEFHSKRNPRNPAFEQSVWIFRSELSDSCELHEHLDWLLHFLESKRDALQGMRDRITELDIFCTFASVKGRGSVEIDAVQLRRLADLNVDLVMDLYPPQ